MHFRKKPVVIQAFEWKPTTPAAMWPDWFFDAVRRQEVVQEGDGTCTVRTLEDGKDWRAVHVADPGDWIIRGVKGELYPCKPDIFLATYDPAP